MSRRQEFPLLVASGVLLLEPGLGAQFLHLIDAEGHSTPVTGGAGCPGATRYREHCEHDIPAQFEGVIAGHSVLRRRH